VNAQAPPSGPSRLRTWARALRMFSFTASIIPVVVAAALAVSHEGPVRWELLPLVLLGSVLFHAGTNLVSDAADYDRGVDRPGTLGGSGVLVEGLLSSRRVFQAGLVMFALGAGVGLVLVWARGWTVLWLGLAGLAGGFFYGGRPLGYKYHALGDLMVFFMMGPLIVVGAYFVLTGELSLRAAGVSVPVGCLVAAILSSNNLRDILPDTRAGIRTVAILLGLRGAKVEYVLLVGGAYAVVAALVAAGALSPWCLLVALSLPPAAKNIALIVRARAESARAIAGIDVRTAQLHLLFGVLLSVGLGLSAVL